MDQDAARRGLSVMTRTVGVMAGGVVVLAAVLFHMGASINMTDIKKCGVTGYGTYQVLWMVAIFFPFPIYLVLRGYIFPRGRLAFLFAMLLLGAVLASDYWWSQAYNSARWPNDFSRSELCTMMRSLFPRA